MFGLKFLEVRNRLREQCFEWAFYCALDFFFLRSSFYGDCRTREPQQWALIITFHHPKTLLLISIISHINPVLNQISLQSARCRTQAPSRNSLHWVPLAFLISHSGTSLVQIQPPSYTHSSTIWSILTLLDSASRAILVRNFTKLWNVTRFISGISKNYSSRMLNLPSVSSMDLKLTRLL